MKMIVSATLATLAIASASQASAKTESFAKISAAVKVDAFAKADDTWRRRMVNSEPACGAYDRKSRRRVDILIDKYQALAHAVAANDETAAMAAGRELSATVATNERYEKCWSKISIRVGVKSSLPNMF